MANLQEKAWQIRQDVATLIRKVGSGHTGDDMSVTDILTTLYYKHTNCSSENQNDPNRNRFVLGKDHCVKALHCILVDKSYSPKSGPDSCFGYLSKHTGHPSDRANGVEIGFGSLGYGLPYSIDMVLADKMGGVPYRVYTAVGSGGLAEGSVREGTMAAARYKLGNPTAIIDRNRL